MSSEADRSDMKSPMLMDFRRRNVRETAGGEGGAVKSSVEKMAKWSDGVAGRHVVTGGRGESDGQMNRSRVLPLV